MIRLIKPQSLAWSAVAIIAGVAALVMGLLGSDPLGPATVLGAAAVLGFGGPASGVVGLVAVAVALGTPPEALTDTSAVVALVSAAALALAVRAFDPALALLIQRRPVVVAVCLCGLAAAALLLPDATIWLTDQAGSPLVAHAVVNDASDGVQRGVAAAAIVDAEVPLEGLRVWLLAGSLLAAFCLLSLRALGRPPRLGWVVVAVSAGALLLFGVLGMGQLLGGSVDVDTAALAHRWSLEATGYANVVSVDLPAGHALASWSRPIVDPLRILLGVLLLLVAIPNLRGAGDQRALGIASTAGPRITSPGPRPLALLALGLGVVAALIIPTVVTPALLGGALLLCAALVAGRYGASTSSAADLLLASVVVVWVLGWVFPAAGWVLV